MHTPLFKYIVTLTVNLILILGINSLQAQTINEAFRYSQNMSGGTARLNAMAGSFGAMGGDLGVLTINPAGIAAFRESEFTFTPSLHINGADSRLTSSNQESNNSTGFGVDNLGAVFANRPIASNWLTSNFAIGINKVANFNEEIVISGNTNGSITDIFVEEANDLFPDELNSFREFLAFNVFAIDTINFGVPEYTNDFFNQSVSVPKRQTITRSGKINEFSLAWAGNYMNKLSIGASIGIPILEFEERKIYEERFSQNLEFRFRNLFFTETLNTAATGVNFNFGMIYNPIKNLRIGASIKTPSSFFMTDDFDNIISYSSAIPDSIDTNGNEIIETFEDESPLGSFDYRLKTPWKYNLSIGTIFKRNKFRGLLNLDIEMIQYNSTEFNLTSSDQSSQIDLDAQNDLNREIFQSFKSTTNLRLGGELGYDIYRFRAGLGIYDNAFAESANENTTLISLGIGIKWNKAYIDLAYQAISTSQEYRVDSFQEQVAQVENTISNMTMTFGFEF